MLKITPIPGAPSRTTIRLEGKLFGPWVNALEQSCPLADAAAFALDLSAIHFVDAAGRRLLSDLIQSGASIVAASGFVKELLHLENP